MTNKPQEVTKEEWDELFACKEFTDQFDDEAFETREDFIAWICAVKFHFIDDCPGYAGDVFIFMAGLLDVGSVLVMYRDRDEGLKVLREW